MAGAGEEGEEAWTRTMHEKWATSRTVFGTAAALRQGRGQTMPKGRDLVMLGQGHTLYCTRARQYAVVVGRLQNLLSRGYTTHFIVGEKCHIRPMLHTAVRVIQERDQKNFSQATDRIKQTFIVDKNPQSTINQLMYRKYMQFCNEKDDLLV